MKKMIVISAGILLFSSTAIFAENHTAEALEHANAAVVNGADGQTSILLKHTNEALKHTLAASEEAEGESKTHLEAAAKELEETNHLGKWGHVGSATAHAEAALKHIKNGHEPTGNATSTQNQ